MMARRAWRAMLLSSVLIGCLGGVLLLSRLFCVITVIHVVPASARGLFAVHVSSDYTQQFQARGGVVRLEWPDDGVLRARSVDGLHDWHREVFVDENGSTISDCLPGGSYTAMDFDGVVHWYCRGDGEKWKVLSGPGAYEARRRWLREKGLLR